MTQTLSHPQRILYLHSSNELYGADRSLLRLIRKIDRQVYQIEVVLPGDLFYAGALEQELNGLQVPNSTRMLAVLRRRYMTPLGILRVMVRLFRSSLKISKMIRLHEIDIVHSNSMSVLTGAVAARMAGIPHIWHIREILVHPNWLHRLMSQLVPMFSKVVITVSEAAKQHIVQTNPASASKVQVIYNGIVAESFQHDPNLRTQLRHEWGWKPEWTGIGMIGRISSWKGQEILVQAAAEMHKAHPQARFVIVGGTVPGEEWRRETLDEQIRTLGLCDVMRVEEFRPDIRAVLSALDVFVLPSTRPDPFPTVVLEAMAAGLPVIATNHGGPTEQVVDGETGLLIEPGNAQALARAIARLIDNPDRQQIMGQAGLKRVHDRFTVERYVRAFESLYDSLLET